MGFKIVKMNCPEVCILEYKHHKDDRGSFSRLFCMSELKSFMSDKSIVQINHSYTQKKGTIRGLHFQFPPYCEMKFIKVLRGEIFDVVLDLRTGKHCSQVLNEQDQRVLVIPEGFAHGFQTLKDGVEILYLHSALYQPDFEGGINPFDKQINISWPIQVTDFSKRDKDLPMFEEIQFS